MAIRFFHTPRNKRFNYKPIYYNEQEEELKERVEKIKREMGYTDEAGKNKPYTSTIRKGQMRGYYNRSTQKKRQSSIRLVIIFFVLLLLAYFLLYY